MASVRQGRQLRNDASALSLEVNVPFAPLVVAPPTGKRTAEFGDQLILTVLGPSVQRVEEFQEEWDEQLEKLGLAEDDPNRARAAEYLDKSAFNLASIVVLAESNGKRMLLTGDARGDDILAGLAAAGFGDPIHVDLLKLPHHGSDRNVETDFFRSVIADHYVISGDGRHGNPEIETLEMISEARDDDAFTIHLTNREARLDEHFEAERAAGRTYGVVYRDPAALSLRVDLG
jgi:hypothetical protein